MKKKTLTHVRADGGVGMVDVSGKPDQRRRAVAAGLFRCRPATLRLLRRKALPKGDALAVAQVAGIQAAKQTSLLIPLCHPLPLHKIEVAFRLRADGIGITATAVTTGKTGVEMEALTAVSVAALSLYDMCKAVDDRLRIEAVRLVEKTKEG